MNNVKDHIAKNIPLMNFINALAFWGLSLTTLYTANSTALAKLEPILGHYRYLVPAAALLIGFVILMFFDIDLRKNLITSMQVFTASDWKETGAGLKTVAIFFLFIAVIRLGLSTGATFISGRLMADAIVEDGDTDGLEKMLQDKAATKQTIAIELSRQVSDTRKSADKQASELVASAIASGPVRWQQLYKQRNGWFLKQSGDVAAYLKRIRDAETAAQRIRNAAETQISAITATQSSALEQEQHDGAFQAVVEAKTAQIEKAAAKERLMQFSLWMLDGLFSIIAILTSIGLVIGLKCRPDYELFREETPASAIVAEMILSVWRIIKSYGVAVVGWLDKKSELVVENIGAIVSVNGRTVSMQRRNVSRNAATPTATGGNSAPDQGGQSSQGAVANGVSGDSYLVSQQLEKARGMLRSYRSKLARGEGTKTTVERGVAKWEKEVERLEFELQNLNQ